MCAGKEDYFVRAVFEVPPGRGYVVGDIKIAGKPIEFGAQIADFITIKLEGLATRIGAEHGHAVPGLPRGRAAAGAPPSRRALAVLPLPSDGAAAGAAPRPLAAAVARAAVETRGADRRAACRKPCAASSSLSCGGRPRPRPLCCPIRAAAGSAQTRMVSGQIMAYASPDSTYAVTKKLIDSAQRSIVIGIYDFSADYMKDALKQAMRRGVTVSLMLDTNAANDPTCSTSSTAGRQLREGAVVVGRQSDRLFRQCP